MNGHYRSKRQNIVIRRIALRNGEQYQVRPAFVMPMMVARTEDVQAGLFLRKFGVPYWVLVRLYGRNETFSRSWKATGAKFYPQILVERLIYSGNLGRQEDCKVAFFLGTQASSLPVSS